MAVTTSFNIWQAIVQAYRANATLKAALTGGFHEGFAPEKAPYPLGVYTPVTMPYEDAWGSRIILAIVDVKVFSRDPVQVGNLDQSFAETLDGASLTVTGQTTLICRRINDIRMPPDLDEEGLKVYSAGGSYEIWTDQPLS
jgi:hypothetical protein